MGSTPRICLHPQCKSLYIHPIINSPSFSSPTAYNRLCPASKLPCLPGLSPYLKYLLVVGNDSRRNERILRHLSNQGWILHANITRGQTCQRHILSECVRPSVGSSSSTPTDNLSVVNPSIRMSWIMTNWEKEWSDNAVDTIKELVSFISEFLR